jgi:hypothetical protein
VAFVEPSPCSRLAALRESKEFNVIGLALSDTIGAIHDCALDPHQWPDTCRKIADLCESTAGGICVHDMRHVQNDQFIAVLTAVLVGSR